MRLLFFSPYSIIPLIKYIASAVPFLALNPYCVSCRCLSRGVAIRFCSIAANSLYSECRSDIGPLFLYLFVSFLIISTTLALNISIGMFSFCHQLFSISRTLCLFPVFISLNDSIIISSGPAVLRLSTFFDCGF